jgi:site-specific DNA-cytosine methylase
MERIQMGIERFCGEQQVVPLLVETCRSYTDGALSRPVTEPGFTQTTSQSIGVAYPGAPLPFVVNVARSKSPGRYTSAVTAPLPTLTTQQEQALVSPPEWADQWPPFLVPYYRNGKPYGVDRPLCTVTTKHRNGLCLPPEVSGEITDVDAWRFRMLDRYEVQAAMGFDPDYQIIASSQREAVRQLGLAVTPIVAERLVRAALEALG